MNQKNRRVIVILMLLVLFVIFVGCDISAYDKLQTLTSSEATSKAKPAPSVTTPPTIYTGIAGDVVFLDEADQVETFWDEGAYVYLADLNGDGIVDPSEVVDKASATHVQTGVRLAGYYASNFTLWAGKTNDAGNVTISNDAEGITITIDTNEAADIGEYHINVYTDQAAIPATRPAPGLSEYVMENLAADTVQIHLSFSELGGTIDAPYYFIMHTALTDDADANAVPSLAGETAYAAGNNPVFTGKGAWYYVVGYTAVAYYEPIIKELSDGGGDTYGWLAETAYGGNSEGDTGAAWWFYIDASDPAYNESTVHHIYAGQHLVEGAYLTYAKQQGKLSIVLGENMVLQNTTEAVKINGYDVLPAKRPPSGNFPVKLGYGASLESITVGTHAYLIVHLDVWVRP
jgi:hypothetical protein